MFCFIFRLGIAKKCLDLEKNDDKCWTRIIGIMLVTEHKITVKGQKQNKKKRRNSKHDCYS